MSKVLSIEIDDERIKIVEGLRKFKSENITLIKCISISTPTKVFDDGKILDINLAKTSIEKALRLNSIKTKKAIFIINSNSAIIRKMDLPLLNKKSETLSMINLELEHLFSSNIKQKVFYKKVDNISDNMARYLVYSLSYDLYNQYIELSEELGLNLLAIELSSKVLEKIPKINIKINNKDYLNAINAFVNIGTDRINFCVINNGVNDFFSIIYFNSYENNLYYSDRVAEEHYLVDSVYYNAGEKYLNILIDEIYKQIRYYYYIVSKDISINKIYFYGNCSKIVDDIHYLSAILNIDVEIISSLSKLDEKVDETPVQEYLNCILSLFITYNDGHFLTDKNKARINKFIIGIVLMTVSIIFMLIIFLFTHNYLFNSRILNKQLETMMSFIECSENIAANKEIEMIKKDILVLEEYIENAIILREIIDEEDFITAYKIDAIRKAKPKNTRITFISFDDSYINMQCKSYYIEDIMLFVKELRNVDFLSNIYVPGVSLNRVENNEYSYSIICNIGDKMDD